MTPVETPSRGVIAPALPGIALGARSEQGRRLVETIDELAPMLAERAAAHDRDGSFPFESLDDLQGAGVLAAPVPEKLGGLGVTQLHDLIVASVHLARADASLAIGVNMHLVLVHATERLRAVLQSRGRDVSEIDESLIDVANGTSILAAAISERSQVLTRPSTRATRTSDGWIVEGRKIFSTLSPAATVLLTAVTYLDPDGRERYAYVRIPVDAPGVIVHDDWDALGMRASGSHSVTFAGVEVPPEAVSGGFPVGDEIGYMQRNLNAGLFHAAASLGIAEAAIGSVAGRGVDARATMLAAENAIDLAAARAMVARAAILIDEDAADLVALFAEAQAAKTFANDAAVRIADRALALSGGEGYLSASPLARHYRDARAGAFMHPLGANRAHELLGRLALGLTPEFT